MRSWSLVFVLGLFVLLCGLEADGFTTGRSGGRRSSSGSTWGSSSSSWSRSRTSSKVSNAPTGIGSSFPSGTGIKGRSASSSRTSNGRSSSHHRSTKYGVSSSMSSGQFNSFPSTAQRSTLPSSGLFGSNPSVAQRSTSTPSGQFRSSSAFTSAAQRSTLPSSGPFGSNPSVAQGSSTSSGPFGPSLPVVQRTMKSSSSPIGSNPSVAQSSTSRSSGLFGANPSFAQRSTSTSSGPFGSSSSLAKSITPTSLGPFGSSSSLAQSITPTSSGPFGSSLSLPQQSTSASSGLFGAFSSVAQRSASTSSGHLNKFKTAAGPFGSPANANQSPYSGQSSLHEDTSAYTSWQGAGRRRNCRRVKRDGDESSLCDVENEVNQMDPYIQNRLREPHNLTVSPYHRYKHYHNLNDEEDMIEITKNLGRSQITIMDTNVIDNIASNQNERLSVGTTGDEDKQNSGAKNFISTRLVPYKVVSQNGTKEQGRGFPVLSTKPKGSNVLNHLGGMNTNHQMKVNLRKLQNTTVDTTQREKDQMMTDLMRNINFDAEKNWKDSQNQPNQKNRGPG